MLEAKASSVVITERSKPVGIVTKADLLEMIASFEPREGVFLQLTGLEGHDPFISEDLFAEIEPAMKRLAHHVRPLTFNLHVIEHHRNYGHRVECRARLLTDRGLFTASEDDDDILRAAIGVLENLEKQIVREKDRSRPSPRKARAGVPPAKRARAV
jgi:ribosome-associated translation inhibitor RaiA